MQGVGKRLIVLKNAPPPLWIPPSMTLHAFMGWRAFAQCVLFGLSQGLTRPLGCIYSDNFIHQTFLFWV